MLRERPVLIDPLSDILALLKPDRVGSGAVNFGGEWSVNFPASAGVRCYAVSRGSCWIEVEGCGPARQLLEDDCIVLGRGKPFQIGNRLDVESTAQFDHLLFSNDRISTVNGGGACVLIGGHFLLDSTYEKLLSTALLPLVVVRAKEQRDTLGTALRALWLELEGENPGRRLIIDHLNQMMLVVALRLCITAAAQTPSGWLSALADKRIAKAFAAIHEAPEKAWTLQALAAQAGMSRTIFAERFKSTTGFTPMSYLTEWRMAIAAHHLRLPHTSVAEVAAAAGYGSTTAFSAAFRKMFGLSPSSYARLAK